MSSRFGLTAEQERLAAEVREVTARELRPLAEAGTPGRVNRHLIKTMGQQGLLRRLFPGAGVAAGAAAGAAGSQPGASGDQHRGVDITTLCLLREALATECTEAETALALQGLGSYPVLQSGSPQQVRRWLPAVAAGEAVPAFALSEPGAGSDAAAISLTAEPDGDSWRLTGEKAWISNAPEADFYTVFALTTAKTGGRGVSAFLVPADRAGLTGEHIDMLSPHPIGTLVFDGVPVTSADLIGEPDHGFAVAMRTLEKFRPSVGAFGVGMAQAALEAALAHAESRIAFGAKLADQQAVAHLLAEMATRTEAARLLVYSAAAALDGQDATGPGGTGSVGEPSAPGIPVAARSAMAKLFATETAQFVVDAAVQIHGARALRRGHLLEHLYREVRAPRIYEGATEIQRTIISRALRRQRGAR